MPLFALVEVVHGNLDRLEGPCGRVEGLFRQLRRVEDLLAEAAAARASPHLSRGTSGVRQRVEAVWEDEDGSTDWFPATIVAHWPTNSEHDRLLMHFDDGMDEIITLPDDTVRLTGEAVVARCKCARCAVRPEAEDGGCTLPLPQPARPRRRS